jgi:dTDP-4-dehydrorhamnose reductase
MVPTTTNGIIITGGTGYIGSVIRDFLVRGLALPNVLAPTRGDMDVTQGQAVQRYFREHPPAIVLHLAARAETDWCETHFPEARRVNVDGTFNVVRAGLDMGATVVYFSSACLYPDNKKAYRERDEMKAFCRYTQTKLLAEQIIEPFQNDILIIRMRQPFSNHRHPRNLLQKLAGYREFIDEPNSMSHLEECIPIVWDLARRNIRGPVNLTNVGSTSPLRIARMIQRYWQPDMPVTAISYDELLARVKSVRVNSLVDCSCLEQLGYTLSSVEKAVEDCLSHPCNLGEYSWRQEPYERA